MCWPSVYPIIPADWLRCWRPSPATDIVVEYLYSFVRNAGDHALIIFRVDKLDEAEKVLTEAGVRLLSQDEVRGL